MSRQLKTLIFSLLTPGLGYLENGDKKSFCATVGLFYGVIIIGAALRLFVSFSGLLIIIILMLAIYFFAAIHATFIAKEARARNYNAALLKTIFTISFILVTGLSFANRLTLMGFDIMKMEVPVMQPTILEGDRFLIDTWIYKHALPKTGDIAAHSFNGQKGLYLNRIVAIGNDKIEIKNGIVLLNDRRVNELYVLSANVTKPQSLNMKALIVPAGHYFVMGDNRDASFGDSRFSGTITLDNIVGKVTDIIALKTK